MDSEKLARAMARRIASELDLTPDEEDSVRELIEEEIIDYTSIY